MSVNGAVDGGAAPFVISIMGPSQTANIVTKSAAAAAIVNHCGRLASAGLLGAGGAIGTKCTCSGYYAGSVRV